MKDTLRQTPRIILTKSHKVEYGELRRFAAATGNDNPIFFDSDAAREAGYKDILAAPTFPDFFNYIDEICAALDLEIQRLTLCSQNIDWFRPLYAGEDLDIIVTLSSSSERRNANMKLVWLTIDTEAQTKRNVPIFKSSRTFIYTTTVR